MLYQLGYSRLASTLHTGVQLGVSRRLRSRQLRASAARAPAAESHTACATGLPLPASRPPVSKTSSSSMCTGAAAVTAGAVASQPLVPTSHKVKAFFGDVIFTARPVATQGASENLGLTSTALPHCRPPTKMSKAFGRSWQQSQRLTISKDLML